MGGEGIGGLRSGAGCGWLLTAGVARRGARLLAATGFLLLLVPVAAVHFEPRFGLPATAPLAAASGLALSGAIARVKRRASLAPTHLSWDAADSEDHDHRVRTQ